MDFNVDVELDVLIFGLRRDKTRRIRIGQLRQGQGPELAFISSSIVSAKVGMGCFGSFLVLTYCIPPSPNQFRSLICPAKTDRFQFSGALIPVDHKRHHLSNPLSVPKLTTFEISVNSSSIRKKETRMLTRIVEHNYNIIRGNVDVC